MIVIWPAKIQFLKHKESLLPFPAAGSFLMP